MKSNRIVGVVDFELDDGKKVTIDLRKISIAEFRVATNEKSDQDKSDDILAKACGMKLKEVQGLPYPDYRRIVEAFWKASTMPLEPVEGKEPPNSQSESTSD